jgi:hypothetical protein
VKSLLTDVASWPRCSRPKRGAVAVKHVLVVVSVALLLPALALADEPAAVLEAAPAQPDQPPPNGVVGNGGWLFSDSPFVASTWQPVVISRFSYTDSASLSRPFAANIGAPGAAVELGGELGLGGGFSLQGTAIRGSSFLDDTGATGGMVGFRFSVLPRSVEHWQLVLNAGYLHELAGGNGAWGTLQTGFETGILRAQLSIHVEHIFQTGRDPVDVMVTAGAAVRVLSFMSLGVEYLGQDLEAAFDNDSDAEGGSRHLLGPTVALAFFENRLSIVAGPAVGLGATGTHLMGRLAVSFGF